MFLRYAGTRVLAVATAVWATSSCVVPSAATHLIDSGGARGELPDAGGGVADVLTRAPSFTDTDGSVSIADARHADTFALADTGIADSRHADTLALPDTGISNSDSGPTHASSEWDGTLRDGICAPSGWCLVYPSYVQRRTIDASASSATNLWTIDADGSVFHFNGASWRGVLGAIPGASDIWTSGPDDAWIVTRVGALWNWNGTRWQSTELPAGGAKITKAWSSGPFNAWAVGDLNTALRWDGVAWTRAALGFEAFEDLVAMHGSGRDDILVVGSPRGGGATHIRHFDGTSWTDRTPSGQETTGVWTFGPTDAWAVGSGRPLLHWDGTQWSAVSSSSATAAPDPTLIVGEAGGTFYFGTEASLQYWDGARVTRGATRDRYDGRPVAFAGQWYFDSIDRNNSSVHSLVTAPTFAPVARYPASSGRHHELADGTILIVGAETWIRSAIGEVVPSPSLCTPRPFGFRCDQATIVAGRSARDIWMAWGGVIGHWDGASWTRSAILDGRTLFEPSEIVLNERDTWAVAGSRLHRYDGASWSTPEVPVGSFDAWTHPIPGVGSALYVPTLDKLWRYDGAAWTHTALVAPRWGPLGWRFVGGGASCARATGDELRYTTQYAPSGSPNSRAYVWTVTAASATWAELPGSVIGSRCAFESAGGAWIASEDGTETWRLTRGVWTQLSTRYHDADARIVIDATGRVLLDRRSSLMEWRSSSRTIE